MAKSSKNAKGAEKHPKAGNPQPKNAVPKESVRVPYTGVHPNFLDVKSVLGERATKLLSDKYKYLIAAKKLTFENKQPHDHGYMALARQIFEEAILSGLSTNTRMVDVRASNRNQYRKRYYRGEFSLRHQSVHGIVHDSLESMDPIRLHNWTNFLKNIDPTVDATSYITAAKNICRASSNKLCDCRSDPENLGTQWTKGANFMAIDAFQHTNVQDMIYSALSAIGNEQSEAYVTYFDFTKVCHKQQFSFPDDEGTAFFTANNDTYMYNMEVRGNEGRYRGPVLRALEHGWVVKNFHGRFLFRICDRIPFEGVDYVLVKIIHLANCYSDLADVPVFEDMLFTKNPEEFTEELFEDTYADTYLTVLDIASKTIVKVGSTIKSLFTAKQRQTVSELPSEAQLAVEGISKFIKESNIDEEGYICPTQVSFDKKTRNLIVTTTIEQKDGSFHRPTLTIIPELLNAAIADALFRNTTSDFGMQWRRICKNNLDKLEAGDTRINALTTGDTLVLAQVMAIRLSTRYVSILTNKEHDELRRLVQGGMKKVWTWTNYFRKYRAAMPNKRSFWQWTWIFICIITFLSASFVDYTNFFPILKIIRYFTTSIPTQDMCYLTSLSEEPMIKDCMNETLLYALVAILCWIMFVCEMIRDRKITPLFNWALTMLVVWWIDSHFNLPFVAAMQNVEVATGKGAPLCLVATVATAVHGIRRRTGFKATYIDRNAPDKVVNKPKTEKQIRKQGKIMSQWLSKGWLYIVFILYIVQLPVARAHKPEHSQTNKNSHHYLLALIPVAVFILLKVISFANRFGERIFEKTHRIWVPASCVTDDSRLNFAELPEEAIKSLKIYGNLFNVFDLPSKIRARIGCVAENKVYAGQVGPFIHGHVRRMPTIKHPCQLTTLAALKRGLEAVVKPEASFEQLVEAEFERLAEKVKGYITKEGGMKIDLQEWLENHPIKYREKILRSQDNEDKKYVYDIFPKVELQQTEVDPELHETRHNGLKERCIYGPQDRKKFYTGPFMWALEKLMHRNSKVYCGMKNWSQICEALYEAEQNMTSRKYKPTGAEADFSRYDSTQKKFILKAFTRFIENVSGHSLIEWGDDQSRVELLDYVRNSEFLRLFAFQGQVQAKTYTRASGDTWTTVGNTITSMVLWSVVLTRHGFNPDLDGPKPGFKPVFMMMKGDDMIGIIDIRDIDVFRTAVREGFNRDNTPTPHGVGCIVKVVETGPLDTRSYLSNYFFRRGDGTFRMIRKPERVFMTLGFSTKITVGMKNLDNISRELLFAKGQCLLAWSEGLPIFDVLARKMISLGLPNHFIVGYADKARICTDVKESDYNDCAEWMWYKYGVTHNDIDALEQAIRGIQDPICELEHAVLDRFTFDE